MAEVSSESPQSEDHDAPSTEVPVDPEVRLDQANQLVQRNVYWAMGAGVLPLPIIDMVAITGVQLKMLRQLSKLYDVPFREGAAKKAVTSLLVGLGGVGIGTAIGASVIKALPILGQSIGAVSVPVISGMLTHAVGRTFVMHFESGGSLLDFDAKKMRGYFKQEYGRAKDVVGSMDTSDADATQASAV